MTIVKELDALHVNGEEYKFPAGEGDMKYSDFSLVTKSGATITLDLFSEIEPSENFTINAPSEIKEGQMYILRVTTGTTPYTMTLGTGITNPYNESTTLTANTVHQFGFLAVDGNLELQPSVTQSGGGEWGTITGTLSDQTDLQTALNAKANASDVNTKTFYLSGTSDTTTAQAIIDWIAAGKNPIINYSTFTLTLSQNSNGVKVFRSTAVNPSNASSYSYDKVHQILIYENSGTVSYINIQDKQYSENYLSTDVNYPTPFIPQYDGSPATKKYVDDSVKTYTAGTGLTLSGTEFSADTTVLATKTDLANIGSYEVVATLPSAETADTKKIYLLGPIGTGADKYEEWIVVDNAGWECEGQLNEIPLVLGNSNTTAYVEVGDPVLSELKATRGHTIYIGINYTTSTSSYNNTRFNFGPRSYYYGTNYNDVPHIQTQSMGQYDGFSGGVNGNMRIGTSNSTNKLVDYSMVWSFSQITYRTKAWTKIGETSIDLSGYATTTALTNGLATKQDTLVSGTNIKTINNESLLGSGNITISAPTYTAGEGIDITNDEISVDTDVIQEKLTAGDGITIENVCTDISDMQGPAPDGFHVPLNTEWQAMYDIWTALGGGSSDGPNFGIALKLPLAGNRFRGSSSVSDQGACGRYRSSARTNASNAYSILFDSSVISPQTASQRSNGLSVRCFKNSPIVPTPSWTKLYGMSIESGGIFWSSTDGLISLSSNGQTWVTIMDKNLGATTVWNSGDTLSEANCGKYYQRGNNYGFPRTGTVTTSSTQVDASAYGPGNYYSSSTFITRSSSPYRWDTTDNANLRGGVSQGSSQECVLTISSTVNGFNPSNAGTEGQVLTKTSTGYDWANAQGGGGNVIAMTQAEYNALTIEEKNDGKLRIITDAPTEDISVDWNNVANKKVDLSTQTGNLSQLKFWIGTTTAYQNLDSYDNNTVYICKKVIS